MWKKRSSQLVARFKSYSYFTPLPRQWKSVVVELEWDSSRELWLRAQTRFVAVRRAKFCPWTPVASNSYDSSVQLLPKQGKTAPERNVITDCYGPTTTKTCLWVFYLHTIQIVSLPCGGKEISYRFRISSLVTLLLFSMMLTLCVLFLVFLVCWLLLLHVLWLWKCHQLAEWMAVGQ